MNLYIDESGSFAHAPKTDSWNVVAALACAEPARHVVATALKRLRAAAGISRGEVKINSVNEASYLEFIQALVDENLILFAVATDAGINSPYRVTRHQTLTVENIRSFIPKMHFEGGKEGLRILADELQTLSPQLYVQLVCQVSLLHDVLGRSINYFAQRRPATLREFRWRIDQKNSSKTTFERAFEKIAPALLQTRSMREPFMWVKGFDYSHMSAYQFGPGEFPDYLQTEYGLPAMDGFNVQKLVRGNLQFVDSKSSDGVQAVDLLVSGLARLLRGKLSDSDRFSDALGRLTLQNRRSTHSINLVSFSENEEHVTQIVSKVIRGLDAASRPVLTSASTR